MSEEKYIGLRGEQDALYMQLKVWLESYKKLNYAVRPRRAEEFSNNAEQTFGVFVNNHTELQQLNNDKTFDHRSYFVEKRYEAGMDKYNQLKTLIVQAVSGRQPQTPADGGIKIDDFAEKSFESMENVDDVHTKETTSMEDRLNVLTKQFDQMMKAQMNMSELMQGFLGGVKEQVPAPTIPAKVQENVIPAQIQEKEVPVLNQEKVDPAQVQETPRAQTQEKKIDKGEHTAKAEGNSKAHTSTMATSESTLFKGLMDLVGHRKNEIEFPKFPAKELEYREWRNQVDIWVQEEGDLIGDKKKMQNLKMACESNEQAKKAVSRFDISNTNFEECLKKLDKRFLVVRNVLYQMTNTLAELPQAKGADGLMAIYDTVISTLTNMESLIKTHVLPAAGDSELDKLKVKEQILNGILCGFIVKRVDDGTNTHIASKLNLQSNDVPDPFAMLDVIETKFINQQASKTANKSSQPHKQDETRNKKFTVSHVGKPHVSKPKACMFCEKPNHVVTTCRQLSAVPVADRYKAVKEKGLCFMCLSAKFGKCNCSTSQKKCSKCPCKHHVLLHDDNWKPKSTIKTVSHIGVAAALRTRKIPVVPTAVVTIRDKKGVAMDIRVFIDGLGAQVNLITQECVDKLGLKMLTCQDQLNTYCDTPGDPIAGKVNVIIESKFSDFKLHVEALVTERLPGNLPEETCYFECEPKKWDNLNLADDIFPGPVEMILGITAYRDILRQNMIKTDEFIMQETALGYIVFGEGKAVRSAKHIRAIVLSDLDKFFEFELENMEKEDYVDKFYEQTVICDEDGYTVKIPWKPNKELGDSQRITKGRVCSMLKRLSAETLQAYVKQIDDLVAKGYMRPAPKDKVGKNYIANFALKTNSLTTPVRILYTCDQKTSNGRSINDVQYCGPKLQNDLSDCIVKFRRNKIAVTGDIKKMYLQIKVDEEDAAHQRTFIGRSAEGPLIEMELPTVIFGMKSAPYLALKTLQHIAGRVEEISPIAARMLRENFYVDDLLDSFDTVEEATDALNEVINALKLGKFELKKIASSNQEVLMNFPKADTLESISKELEDETVNDEVKVLGIMWDRKTDQMHYKVNIEKPDAVITKRKATSVVAGIYDPTGCLGPFLLGGKILIQKMWRLIPKPCPDESKEDKKKREKAEWDAPLPTELNEEFSEWQAEVPELKKVKIERWIGHSSRNKEELLIGFADASEKAYGCVIYLRSVDEDDQPKIQIVGAKSRVTPLSNSFVPTRKEDELKIPRLELMAATMLANYMKVIKAALNVQHVMAFTDSKITLAWIQGNEDRWLTFVANRTQKIKAIIPETDWHYVNTKVNPADLISRGIRPSQSVDSEDANLWFRGPAFIHEKSLRPETASFDTKLDERKCINIAAVKINNDIIVALEKISTWQRTVRVMAYVLRFKQLLKYLRQKKQNAQVDTLSWTEKVKVAEHETAVSEIIKLHQRQTYGEEINSIKEKRNITKGKLQSLTPFKDKNGVLRVGGRLEAAKFISFDEKHQMILPKLIMPKRENEEDVSVRSLTRKIIEWAHLATMHGGEAKVLAFIRQKYYIPGGRNAVRFVLHRCLTCRVHRADTYKQLMGNLPKECLNPAPPFFHTTTDYAGPILIRHGTGRGRRAVNKDDEKFIINNKAWIAVYVCRLTGAYHIELVQDLTAASCLDAFRRFVSTRGLPRTVTSDNATTFKKAMKLLRENEKKAYKIAIEAVFEGEKEIQKQFAFKQVEMFTSESTPQWRFNPPLAPDFGGKHEAAVKQIKILLKKVIGDKQLPFMLVMTFLKEVEAALNSRPLCRVEGSAADQDQILTPAHFLVGRPLNALPEPEFTGYPNLTDRYKIQQGMVQHFWKLWQGQYLAQLQQLPKWTSVQDDVQVGEVVLLKEDNTPPLVWRKARVTKVHQGKDSLVRVVTVKDSKQKEFDRSIRKIVKLPIVIERGEAAVAAGKTPVLPFITPNEATQKDPTPEVPDSPQVQKNPKAQVVDSPQDPNSDKPPLRRSARNQKKTGLSRTATVMALLCVIAGITPTVAVPLNAEPSSDGTKTINETKTGLAYFYKRDIMIQIGTHHIEIKTNLCPETDSETIRSKIKMYNDACHKAATGFPLVYCRELNYELETKANNTIANIMKHDESNGNTDDKLHQEKEAKPRSKRDYQKGALIRLFEWAFGSWSDDTESNVHAGKSMGVVKHAVTSFIHVERQLQRKEENLQKELHRLAEGVDQELLKHFAEGNQNRINTQLLSVFDLIMHHIMEMERIYDQVEKVAIEGEEIQNMVDKINKQLLVGVVPQISNDQLYELFNPKKKFNKEKGDISVILDMPVVYKEKFEEFMVIPLPVEGKDLIPDVEPHDIVVNRRLQRYIMNTNVQSINETLAITLGSVNTMHKWKEGADCTIAGLLNQKPQCKYKTLPKSYDVWMDTPLHNQVAFYSTMKREMICQDSRTTIKETSGVILIPRDCEIETDTVVIIASQDSNAITRHGFHMMVEETKIDWTQHDVQSLTDQLQTDNDTTRISEDGLLDTLKEAVDVSQEGNSLDLTVIIIAVTAIVTGGLVLAFWVYRKTKKPNTASHVYEAVSSRHIQSIEAKKKELDQQRTNPTNNTNTTTV